MRHVFTIHGIKEDGSKYAVVAYDSIRETKRHFVKLEQLLKAREEKSDIETLSKYDLTNNIAVKYVVTKVLQYGSLKGYEWFHKITLEDL